MYAYYKSKTRQGFIWKLCYNNTFGLTRRNRIARKWKNYIAFQNEMKIKKCRITKNFSFYDNDLKLMDVE